MRKARYSGPNRSGVCVCGCSWKDHHLGMVMRQDAIETDGGPEYYIPQECERYGSNEAGGLKYNKKTGEYEDHCFGYKDTLDASSN